MEGISKMDRGVQQPLHDIRFKRVCREAHVWVSEATAIKVIKRLESFGDPDASISDRHNVVRILFVSAVQFAPSS